MLSQFSSLFFRSQEWPITLNWFTIAQQILLTILNVHSGQTSFSVFQSLEVWISSNTYEREVRVETMHNTSRQTEFHVHDSCCILNTYSTQKFRFWETALSFSVKVKLWIFVWVCLCKIMAELRKRRAFERCESWMRLNPFDWDRGWEYNPWFNGHEWGLENPPPKTWRSKRLLYCSLEPWDIAI